MVPLSIDRVRVLAAAYAHRYICICATADQPMWRGDYWEVAIDTTELSHSSGFVRIDRRTGEISYPGQPSASIGEVEEWLKSQRTGRRGAKK